MRRVGLFVIALMLPSIPTEGQIQPMEFSVDGGFQLDAIDNAENVTSFTLPFQQIRFAVGINARASLEGRFQFRLASQGDNSVTGIFLAPAFAYLFREYESQASRPYLSVFGGLSHVDSDTGIGSRGDTQFGFGAEVGVKLPVAESGFIRLAAGLGHFPESDNRSSASSISLSIGLGGILD